jgi:hypothetical protein
MHLLKQVRPGMDLSKVVLPTFILEPRSFLEKLSDYYHHCDILEEYVNFRTRSFYKKLPRVESTYQGNAENLQFDSKTWLLKKHLKTLHQTYSFYHTA